MGLNRQKTNALLNKFINWLLETQVKDIQSDGYYGLYPAWIDANSQKPSFGYSEITGYSMSLNSFLARMLKLETNRVEHSAELSYTWIKNHFEKYGFFKTRLPLNTDDAYLIKTSDLRYLFDTGMVLNGLVNYAQFSEREDVIKTAKDVAEYMIHSFFPEKKKILPMIADTADSFHPNSLKWSVQTTAFLGKTAIGLAYLYSLDDKNIYSSYLESIVHLLKTCVSKNGIFKTYNEMGRVHFHPLLYAVEAAFSLGAILEDKELTRLAIENLEYVYNHQYANGELPSLIWDGEPVYAFRSDLHFQAIRMGIIFDYRRQSDRFNNYIEKTLEFVLKNHTWENNGDAAIWFGFDAEPLEGSTPRKREHLNVCSTMFAIQSLVLYLNNSAVDFLVHHPTYLV